MENTFGGRSFFAIARFLEGVTFSCRRQDTVASAEDNLAPEEVLDLLERLPERLYSDRDDVIRELWRV